MQIKELDSSKLREATSQNVCQLTQTFAKAIDDLQAAIRSDSRLEQSATGHDHAPQSVSQSVAHLHQQFQAIIAAFEAAHINPQTEQQIRPFLTESHRQLRLAGIEAMRLQTAKQAATVEKQRSLIQSHLAQLQKFASAIANEVCSGL